MGTFDVRNTDDSNVDEIMFADQDWGDYKANVLVKRKYDDGVNIMDKDDGSYVYIESKHHADMLRRALDKAEELGWLI